MRDRYLRYFRSRRPRPPEHGETETDRPAFEAQIRAAFPLPPVSEALQTRVVEICRAAAAPESRGRPAARNRRLWMRTARWGTLGLAATALAIVWLSGRSESDAVAAVLQAMAAAPVIHVVGTGDRGSRQEIWIADGVGSYLRAQDHEKEETLVDDLTDEFRYQNLKHPGPLNPLGESRVEVTASEMADAQQAGRIRAWYTGTGILKEELAGKYGKRGTVQMVQRGGRRLRMIHVHGYHQGDTIYVDPETDRIVSMDVQGPNVLSAPELIHYTLDYPDPATLDRSLFHFQVPTGVSVEDRTDGPVRWAHGDAATCMSQIKALREALRRYANDHHGQWPETLRPALDSYVDSLDVFRCPLAPSTTETSYEYHRPGALLAPRVLAFWNKAKANPRLIDMETANLGGVRPGMIECHLHRGFVLSLYYNGYLVRWTPTPERPGEPAATPVPMGPPPSDPGLRAIRKALAARERRLSEVTVTVDSNNVFLVPTSTWQQPAPGGPAMLNRGPGEFRRAHTILAQKGKQTLIDEEERMPQLPGGYMRRRMVSDGETVLTQYFRRPDEPPKPPQAMTARQAGGMASGASIIGLDCWGQPLSELLNGAAEVQYLGVKPFGGDRCVALALSERKYPHRHARLWLDAGHGYMLRRRQDYQGPHLDAESIATQPREVAPGLFIPTRLTTFLYMVKPDSPALKDGRPTPATHRCTTVVRQVTLGPPPDRLFQPLPSGRKGG